MMWYLVYNSITIKPVQLQLPTNPIMLKTIYPTVSGNLNKKHNQRTVVTANELKNKNRP